MTLQRVQGTAPITDVEFRLSDHMTTKGITIDADLVRAGMYVANEKVLKGGTPMAKVTTSGLYGPVKATTVKTTAAANQKAVTLTDAQFFVVGDVVKIGNETAQAIAAINYTTGVATMTDNLAGEQAAGTAVEVATGQQTAEGILLETVNLTDGDITSAIMTHGVVKSARVIGVNDLVKADLPKIEFR